MLRKRAHLRGISSCCDEKLRSRDTSPSNRLSMRKEDLRATKNQKFNAYIAIYNDVMHPRETLTHPHREHNREGLVNISVRRLLTSKADPGRTWLFKWNPTSCRSQQSDEMNFVLGAEATLRLPCPTRK